MRSLGIAAGLAASVVLAVGASPSLAVTDAQVRACVRDNLIRYSPPDRAVVVQYLDLEGACRSQLERESSAQVDLAPVAGGGSAPGEGGGSDAAPGSAPPGAPASSDDPASSGGGTPPLDDGTSPAARPSPEPADLAQPPGGAPAPSADPLVRDVLAGSDGAAVSAPRVGAGMPIWLLILVVTAIAAVLTASVVEVRRRLK